MNLLTIITPSYNRAFILEKAFNSLCNQTNKDFIWMIVDDGSSDNTAELVKKFQTTALFEIIYIYKANGGKHTALNLGVEKITSELTLILDSDDYLTPIAVQTIYDEWGKSNSTTLCGMSFLKGYSENETIGDTFPQDYMIDNHINLRVNKGIDGDKAEVWRTSILKQNPWPEFDNEKFMAMGYVWNTIAKEYNTLYINKIIYIAEYLEGGLTKSGKKLRINSPIGGMKYSTVYFSREFNFMTQVKYMILYCCYGFFLKRKIRLMIMNINKGYKLLFFCCLPNGFILYKLWKYKYS